MKKNVKHVLGSTTEHLFIWGVVHVAKVPLSYGDLDHLRETRHSEAKPRLPVTPSKFQRSPNRAPSVQSRIVHGWIVPAREVIKRVLLVVDANKLILTVSNTSSFVWRKTNCLSNLSKGVNMCQPVSLSCPDLLQDLLYRLHRWRRRYSFHGGTHSTRHLEQSSRHRLTIFDKSRYSSAFSLSVCFRLLPMASLLLSTFPNFPKLCMSFNTLQCFSGGESRCADRSYRCQLQNDAKWCKCWCKCLWMWRSACTW